MNKMEQLSLFKPTIANGTFKFYGNYCNDDWSCRTKTVDGVEDIVDSIIFVLTKKELLDVCSKAVSVNRRNYGYTVLFEDGDIKKELFVRFTNQTTKKKWTVFDFVENYWDEEQKKTDHRQANQSK